MVFLQLDEAEEFCEEVEQFGMFLQILGCLRILQ